MYRNTSCLFTQIKRPNVKIVEFFIKYKRIGCEDFRSLQIKVELRAVDDCTEFMFSSLSNI